MEQVHPSKPVKRKPGRPRSQRARGAILRATQELIAAKGPAALTVEAVAKRSGVGKPTIYRYWANANELALSAAVAGAAVDRPALPQSKGLDAVQELLEQMVERVSAPEARQTLMLAAAAAPDTDLFASFRNQVVLKFRNAALPYLRDALAAGELRGDVDVEVVLDMVFGVALMRALLGHGPLSPAFIDSVIDQIAHGVLNKSEAAPRSALKPGAAYNVMTAGFDVQPEA